jgi:Uma2 family endonuclease
MKAVMPTTLPEIMALRRRTGADRWDEMWEGVLHMPPCPTPDHQDFEGGLETYLRTRWAKARSAQVYHNINLASVGGWPDDYRIPDLAVFTPGSGAVRRDAYFEGPPAVVIEIRSPDDETLEKLPFYARLGVPEVWILERDTRAPAVYVLDEGHYRMKAPEESGWILSEATGLELRAIRSGRLAIRQRGDDTTREEI